MFRHADEERNMGCGHPAFLAAVMFVILVIAILAVAVYFLAGV